MATTWSHLALPSLSAKDRALLGAVPRILVFQSLQLAVGLSSRASQSDEILAFWSAPVFGTPSPGLVLEIRSLVSLCRDGALLMCTKLAWERIALKMYLRL